MTTTTSRRTILAGATALSALAATIPAVSAETDPAFAAIEAHKAAYAAFITTAREGMALEAELPREKRRSNLWVDEITVVESDDPRWIAHLGSCNAASHAMDQAAVDLLDAAADTTLAGAVALIQHAAEMARLEPGGLWPSVQDDDVKGDEWHEHFHIALAASLAKAV